MATAQELVAGIVARLQQQQTPQQASTNTATRASARAGRTRSVRARRGDTLSSLAESSNSTVASIQQTNGISRVFPGMNVNIPPNPLSVGRVGVGRTPPYTGSAASLTGDLGRAPNPLSVGRVGVGRTPPPITAALTGDISQQTPTSNYNLQGNSVYNGSGFHDPSQEGGAVNSILNQLEATGTFYNSAGVLNSVSDYRSIFTGEQTSPGYRSVADKLIEMQRMSEELGRPPSEFAAGFDVPAIIPPQVASMVFQGLWDASDPNSLNEVTAYFGYGFNPETQVFELGFEGSGDTTGSSGGGSRGGGGRGGGGGGGGGTRTSSVTSSMLNWRIATG